MSGCSCVMNCYYRTPGSNNLAKLRPAPQRGLQVRLSAKQGLNGWVMGVAVALRPAISAA